MEGSDGEGEVAKFTVTTLEAFLKARSQRASGRKQYLAGRAIGCQKPHFFQRTRDLLVSRKTMQRHFSFILHHLSPVILAKAQVVAYVLFCNSRFSCHCYTQCEPPLLRNRHGSGSCDLSGLLARKITRGIHSCRLASLNCPVNNYRSCFLSDCGQGRPFGWI